MAVETRTALTIRDLGFVAPYSTTLSLLAAPKQADSADEIEPEIIQVLQRLRESFDYVVLYSTAHL